MYMFGGEAIKSFFAITLGVLVGTYSSIFVGTDYFTFDRLFGEQKERHC